MKYCKKHDQKYIDVLRWCPICKGEKMKLAKPRIKLKNAKRRAKKLKLIR